MNDVIEFLCEDCEAKFERQIDLIAHIHSSHLIGARDQNDVWLTSGIDLSNHENSVDKPFSSCLVSFEHDHPYASAVQSTATSTEVNFDFILKLIMDDHSYTRLESEASQIVPDSLVVPDDQSVQSSTFSESTDEYCDSTLYQSEELEPVTTDTMTKVSETGQANDNVSESTVPSILNTSPSIHQDAPCKSVLPNEINRSLFRTSDDLLIPGQYIMFSGKTFVIPEQLIKNLQNVLLHNDEKSTLKRAGTSVDRSTKSGALKAKSDGVTGGVPRKVGHGRANVSAKKSESGKNGSTKFVVMNSTINSSAGSVHNINSGMSERIINPQPTTLETLNRQPPFECTVCYTLLPSWPQLLRHIGKHFKCEECEQYFARSDLLMEHEISHSIMYK